MPLAPVYVLCCDDPLLKNERSAAVIAAARREMPQAELMIFTDSDFQSSGEPNLAKLENELVDPGLFGGDRIIKIYLRDFKASQVKVMLLIAQRLRPGVVIVIEMPRIAAAFSRLSPKKFAPFAKGRKPALKAQQEAAIAYLKGRGASVEIMYPPEGAALTSWIMARAAACGLRCSRECAGYIAAGGEGNLIGIDQSLKMLSMTAGSRELSIQMIDAALTQDARFTGFELAAALLAGDGIRALNVLNSLASGPDDLQEITALIIKNLDGALRAVLALRSQDTLSAQQRSALFMRLGIRSLDLQKAVGMAALGMPEKLLSYLTSKLAEASARWSQLRADAALLSLQDLCAVVTNFAVMELEPLC
ncbi:MAG: hypothetical protein SPL30_08965 [Succinivibrio sp.]|jgi:DNA polymerase III delta subunit|nr:hypothetical protein [Succinivibrio sp.]